MTDLGISDNLAARGGAWGSDAMVEQLSRLGLRYVALVPGSSYRGVHDSLVNYNHDSDPKMLLCLHEEHCVAIAHGYAKVTQRPMAAAVHANVGLMHATMAIYNAFCDRAPVVILGATGPLDAARRRPWIDWIHTATDQAALIRHFIKFDDQPHSVQASIHSLVRATAIASQIPRAPVYVCLDVSLQEDALADPSAIHFPTTERYLEAATSPPGAAAEDIERLQSTLNGSKRPLFLFGRVGRSHNGWDERIRLAEHYDARVLTDLKLAAAFPTDHRLHVTAPSTFNSPSAGELIRAADVVVSFDWVDLAGTMQASHQPGGEPAAHVVHISLDSALHNGWSQDHYGHPPVDHQISADVDKSVSSLLAAVSADKVTKPCSTWDSPTTADPEPDKKQANGHMNGIADRANGSANSRDGSTNGTNHEETIYMEDLADALYSVIDPDHACLVRLPLGWGGRLLRATHPLAYLGQDGGAGIGSGPGMAVGAALALRDLRDDLVGQELTPVALLGDGDFLMGASALWTAARYRIPLLVVTANNASFFNDEAHQQRVARGRGRPEANKGVGIRIDDPAPDLTQHAASLGASVLPGGGQVTKRSQLAAALAEALRRVRHDKRLVFVDVRVCPDGYSSALESTK